MIRLVVYPENWLFIYRNLTNYKYNRNLEIHKLTKLGIKLKLQSINQSINQSLNQSINQSITQSINQIMFKHLHI